jgi:hypothetical protein
LLINIHFFVKFRNLKIHNILDIDSLCNVNGYNPVKLTINGLHNQDAIYGGSILMVLHLGEDMTCTLLTPHQVTRVHIQMQVFHTILHQAIYQ